MLSLLLLACTPNADLPASNAPLVWGDVLGGESTELSGSVHGRLFERALSDESIDGEMSADFGRLEFTTVLEGPDDDIELTGRLNYIGLPRGKWRPAPGLVSATLFQGGDEYSDVTDSVSVWLDTVERDGTYVLELRIEATFEEEEVVTAVLRASQFEMSAPLGHDDDC